MRVWTRRHIGVVCLNVLLALGAGACSSSQQEDDSLENYEEQEEQGSVQAEGGQEGYDQEGYDQEASGGQEGGNYDDGNYEGGNYNAGSDDSSNYNAGNYEGGNYGANLGANNLAGNPGQGNSGNNDLQEIISEMNQADAQPGNALNQNQAFQVDQTAGLGGQATATNIASNSVVVDTSTTSVGGVVAGLSGQAAGQGLPELGSKMPYVIRSGDTLAKVSSKIYGTSERWREIATLSGLDNPNTIYPGDVIYYQLTQEAVAFAQAYTNVARQEIVVQQGDTLATISRRAFGSDKFWKSIWRENDHIVNPDQLVVGQTVFYVTDAALSAAVLKIKSNDNENIANSDANSDTELNLTKVSNNQQDIDFEFETVSVDSFSDLVTMNTVYQTATYRIASSNS
ncbi:MAG: LysM peptidoglycan-binding domain-containing protein [Bdellovibrionota bacterium]